jgi:hypothetical protein
MNYGLWPVAGANILVISGKIPYLEKQVLS